MFNLEQAIAEWRQKMLAAGIETPVPLEELELHLREEMERQLRVGWEAEKAFAVAAQSIGDGRPLEVEFRKVGGLSFNRKRIYDQALAAFALYVVFVDAAAYLDGQIFGSQAVGFWYEGICALVGRPIDLPVWCDYASLLIDCGYVAASATMVLARRSQPKFVVQLSRRLNWALLPVLPLGLLIGLYGLWCDEFEAGGTNPKSWLGRLFAFVMTPITDQSTSFYSRLLALPLQVMSLMALLIFSFWQCAHAMDVLQFLRFFPQWFARSPEDFAWFVFLSSDFAVNVLMIWFMAKIFLGLRARPQITLSHV